MVGDILACLFANRFFSYANLVAFVRDILYLTLHTPFQPQ